MSQRNMNKIMSKKRKNDKKEDNKTLIEDNKKEGTKDQGFGT
jgi:hypothetical protein